MKKRLFALFLALTLLLPTALTAGAAETVMECRLRGTYFNSLSEALKVYEDGDVIELLMELHRCCQLAPNDGEIRVRGVDGVRVYDDLFTVGVHQELRHWTEDGVHIFKCVDLERDPSLPEVTVETGTVPCGIVRCAGAFPWPGETVRAEVSPHPGCEVASFTVLDSELNEIPSWPVEDPGYGSDVYYEFVLPAEHLPVKLYAAVRQVGETDENCPSVRFTDVPADAWYHTAVDELVARGALSGKTAGRFVPYAGLTRAEAVTVLYSLAERPDVPWSPVFSDVAEDAWYAGAVLWADREGIVSGVGQGRFAPNALLTWEQLWVMLLALSGEEYHFFRLDTEEAVRTREVSAFAADALTWALDNGIYAADPIHGHASPTRAETAVTVYLYLLYRQKLAEKGE